jgi:hypothetical protein
MSLATLASLRLARVLGTRVGKDGRCGIDKR